MKILILLLCFCGIFETRACSCGDNKKKQLIKGADFAVVIEAAHRQNYPMDDFKPDVKVRVLKSIKGMLRKADTLMVISSVSGSCAKDFIIGERYLVTGSSRLSEYWDLEELRQDDNTDDTVEVSQDYTNIPQLERYDQYLQRISQGFVTIFSDMCRIINH